MLHIPPTNLLLAAKQEPYKKAYGEDQQNPTLFYSPLQRDQRRQHPAWLQIKSNKSNKSVSFIKYTCIKRKKFLDAHRDPLPV